MFIVWIIITALDQQQPVEIVLVVDSPITAWPAESKKAKRLSLVGQLKSTYG